RCVHTKVAGLVWQVVHGKVFTIDNLIRRVKDWLFGLYGGRGMTWFGIRRRKGW
ncbi:hypothetical protein LINPERHAP1_LOCUS16520, partial [Linum perenne]